MMNDFEMNGVISSVIYDSDNISPVVNIKDGTGETVTVDITKLKPGTDVFIDGRLFSKSDQNSNGRICLPKHRAHQQPP